MPVERAARRGASARGNARRARPARTACDKKVVGADVERLDLVGEGAAGGQYQGRHGDARAAQPAHQREPVGARQADVDHREREFLRRRAPRAPPRRSPRGAPNNWRPTVRARSRRRRCRRPQRSRAARGPVDRLRATIIRSPLAARVGLAPIRRKRVAARRATRRAASLRTPWRTLRCTRAEIRPRGRCARPPNISAYSSQYLRLVLRSEYAALGGALEALLELLRIHARRGIPRRPRGSR